jgi:phosphate transport system substrate-binding protein
MLKTALHKYTTFIALFTALVSCGVHAQETTGAGASFPAPAYAKWAEVYQSSTSAIVNYQPIGSSDGIRQIDDRTVDFGATDAPLKDEDLRSKGQIQFPTLIGGVVPVINLRGMLPGQLKLSGKVLADIYLGKITRWSDAAIQGLNPGLALPNANIEPVHRSDGSGTTFIFTNYLSKVNTDWKDKIGEGTSIGWPVGSAGKGSAGVAALVGRIPNSIGYVEYSYAKQARLNFALVANSSGAYVNPSADAFRSAAAGIDWSSNFYHMLTNQASPEAWPITGATFILMYARPRDVDKAGQALRFFRWALRQGETIATELGYTTMSPAAVNSIENLWSQIQDSTGKPIAFK